MIFVFDLFYQRKQVLEVAKISFIIRNILEYTRGTNVSHKCLTNVSVSHHVSREVKVIVIYSYILGHKKYDRSLRPLMTRLNICFL